MKRLILGTLLLVIIAIGATGCCNLFIPSIFDRTPEQMNIPQPPPNSNGATHPEQSPIPKPPPIFERVPNQPTAPQPPTIHDRVPEQQPFIVPPPTPHGIYKPHHIPAFPLDN